MYEQVRMRGVVGLADVRYVSYEEKGGLSIVHRSDVDTPLVNRALRAAGRGGDVS